MHSASAIGEQYFDLVPRSGKGPHAEERRRDPAEPHLDSAEYQFAAVGGQSRPATRSRATDLKTVVDESYIAVGGLGPELSRFISGGATLAIDARKNLDSILTLIDESKPILDSQIDSSDSIQAWAAHLAEHHQADSDRSNKTTPTVSEGLPQDRPGARFGAAR